VLDAYAYTGAFGLAAARGGASEVVCVDESAVAIEVGAENARDNGLVDRVKNIRSDRCLLLNHSRTYVRDLSHNKYETFKGL
jgi:23S rRNA (cytosine1962-C5)-methyltransferase